MPWTLDEIQRDWLGGEHLQLPAEDIVGAFTAAEQSRGRDWVLSTIGMPGGGRKWGFAPFLRVYAFGKRMQTIVGAPGADALLRRLLEGCAAAESELTAIYLLRSGRPATELEVAPQATVGGRSRRPDFRVRISSAPWTYAEVTQLNRSGPSIRMQEMLHRIAGQVISISEPFLLEVVLWREPTEAEVNEVVRQASQACQTADGKRQDIGDLASLMVKVGDPAVVVPSILPEGDRTRMSLAHSVVGPGQPNRQIVVRAPFADMRAEDVLTAEARQLPRAESGLVMVDVAQQPTAFESWAELVPRRFTRVQHTRVGGVLLFMTATTLTTQGLSWLPFLKLIPNPHARIPLPAWITEVVQETRAHTQRLTGRPD